MFHNILLKVFGYRPLIEKNEVDDGAQIDIDIEKGLASVTKKKSEKIYHNERVRCGINYGYRFLILLILAWPPIYAVVASIVEKDGRYFSSNIFSLLFLIQYFIGMIYYKTDHIDLSFNEFGDYTHWIKRGYNIGTGISVVLSIIALILLVTDVNILIYSDLYEDGNIVQKVFTCILLVIEKFVSFNILLINMITFILIFVIYGKKVKAFHTTLNEKISNSEDLQILSIIEDFSNLKQYHTVSVDALNDMFSTMATMGTIGIYFIVLNFGTEFTGPIQIINGIFVLLIDALYIYTITKVKNTVDSIKSVVNSKLFFASYIDRSYLGDMALPDAPSETGLKRRSLSKTASIRTLNLYTTTALKEQKEEIGNIENLATRTLIKSYENGFANEWKILNDKLSSSWASFNVFGFEFTDISPAKKAVALITAYVMTTHLQNQLGFA